jgi:ATP adenylyltransferase
MTASGAGGGLWQLARARGAAARRSGSLRPVVTRIETLHDGGIDFTVRVAQGMKDKDAAAHSDARPIDPFAVPEPDLVVGDLSPTYICLLNKFNVLDDHLLVVTRDFVDQRAPLAAGDFAALQACMRGRSSLGFYNGGREAGASQPHRHLQVVPLPLSLRGPAVPIESVTAPGAAGDGVHRSAALPFRHAFTATGMQAGPRPLYAAYRRLLEATALAQSAADGFLPPYSLLVARSWTLLVPRSRDEVEGIPVNSLGYAGALLVRDEEGLARLRSIGPLEVLARAALRP